MLEMLAKSYVLDLKRLALEKIVAKSSPRAHAYVLCRDFR